ncbi:MAG TPA: type VI secretion system baseplate subunit TssG [Blastocatellia bacterium]|nr:type VI secretion system baseplate subunit TssG [Blastocatellia bacterium]
MAAYGWGKDSPVADWLFEEGHRFNFFQAVKLLEMADTSATSVGEGSDPNKEPVRFGSSVNFNFPASDVAEINQRGVSRSLPTMTVNFMGIAGGLGSLPAPYTELILERLWDNDPALKDFLDIFNHRLISLFYRVRKSRRIGLEVKAPGRDRFSDYMFSAIGLGTGGLRKRMFVKDRSLLFYGGLLAQQPRSIVGLQTVLSDYFGVEVDSSQFRGRWFDLEPGQLTAIGPAGQNQVLGRDTAVVGSRVWDQQSEIEVRLGPMTFDKFADFLPIGWAFNPLCELTRYYLDDKVDFTFRLTLKAAHVPGSRLGGEAGPRLGWTAWLKASDWKEDDSQATVSRRSLEPFRKSLPIPLFRDLPVNELDELLTMMTDHDLPAGSVVVAQGDPGGSLFAVREGSVELVFRETSGEEVSLGRVGAGSCFGEISLLVGRPWTSTATTVEPSRILELTRQSLDEMIAKCPRVKSVLDRYLERRQIDAGEVST